MIPATRKRSKRQSPELVSCTGIATSRVVRALLVPSFLKEQVQRGLGWKLVGHHPKQKGGEEGEAIERYSKSKVILRKVIDLVFG